MRICKNKITDEIRDLFGANPLKIPESRILPFVLMEIKDLKPKYLGQFKFLTKGDLPPMPEVKTSAVPSVSGAKSKNIDLSAGFGILENFLKAFGIDSGVVSSSLKKTKKFSLSFDNVQRLYFEPIELGKYLSDHDVIGDTDNLFISEIVKDDKKRLVLITDVLVSNNFSISSFSESDGVADIDIPLIQKYVADLNLKVDVKSSAANQIKFSGADNLTFAFSCVEIKIDPATGKFSRGEWLENIRAKGAVAEELGGNITDEEINLHSKLLINQKLAAPELLEF